MFLFLEMDNLLVHRSLIGSEKSESRLSGSSCRPWTTGFRGPTRNDGPVDARHRQWLSLVLSTVRVPKSRRCGRQPRSSFRLGRRNPGSRDGKPAGTYNARCRYPIERFVISNNLRAKSGAFVCEPLKAAFAGANATPLICCRLKAVNQRHRFSCSSR